MIYRSDKTVYVPVMEVFRGEVNDVLICRDARAEWESYDTLLVIYDHGTVKRLLRVIERSAHGYACCVEMFQQGNAYCVVFPYVKERYLHHFYMPARIPLKTCGTICENLILACMLSKLPYPLLYLALEQEQLHLRRDYSVEPGYTIDLDELDEDIGEKECAGQCAALLRELLAPEKSRENMAYRLFMKKWDHASLDGLYRDMRLVKKTMGRRGRLAGLRLLLKSRRDSLRKLLWVFCIGVILLAALCLLSRAVWGEIPFLRIFVNHFQVIGTESLIGK